MTKSFAKIFGWIFTQNWILDPEIDSTQRAQQNAHLIDQKRLQKYHQKLFKKNSVKIEYSQFWSDFSYICGYYITTFKTSIWCLRFVPQYLRVIPPRASINSVQYLGQYSPHRESHFQIGCTNCFVPWRWYYKPIQWNNFQI